MNKKLLIIIGAFIILFLLALIILSDKKQTKNLPAPTTIPTTGGSLPNNYYWTEKTREATKKSYAVGELIDKLPFRGQDFSLSYDINEDVFTAILNAENVAAANKEFDSFLAENKIGDRGWIKNLNIRREVLRP